RANIFNRANSAADRQRTKTLLGRATDDVNQRASSFVAGGDVQKTEFIGALSVVARRDFDWIAGVAQPFEVDALDDASVFDIQAGNEALGEHRSKNNRFPLWAQRA